MKSLLFFYAILISIITLLVLVFFKDKPLTPPSYTSQIKREDFVQASKSLIKNKNYIFFMLGASMLFGCTTGGLIVNVSFFVKPFGFTESDTSILVAIIPLTGGLGVFVG